MGTIYGINSVLELLKSPTYSIERILLDKEINNPRLKEIFALAKEKKIPVDYQARGLLNRKAGTLAHQGVIAVTSTVHYASYESIVEEAGRHPLFLILDGIEDPHNLGAIIRTAEAAGVHGIFIPQRRAVGVTETVFKTSAGAAAHVKIARVVNLANLIEYLKENSVWIVGVEAEAKQSWTDVDYNQPLALVLGAEGKGMHRLVKERCDFLVAIPMFGKVSSLNVSVAAGIVLYEVIRQRTTRGQNEKKQS